MQCWGAKKMDTHIPMTETIGDLSVWERRAHKGCRIKNRGDNHLLAWSSASCRWGDCADVLQAPLRLHTHPADALPCSHWSWTGWWVCRLHCLASYLAPKFQLKTLILGQTLCLYYAHSNLLCYTTVVFFLYRFIILFWVDGGGDMGKRAFFCFVSQIAPSRTMRNFPSKTTSWWRERQFRRFSANSGGLFREQDFL